MNDDRAPDAPRVDDQVRYRRVFDEAVLIRRDDPDALVLNDTGAAFLELCDGKRSMEEIVRILAGEYEIDEETLRRDMESFALELVRAGIIHPG